MAFYYMYQITNNLNGKIYVGVHKTTNLNDGYMGSGVVIRRAIEKHGIENFEKVILETFDNSEAMYAREKEVVTEEFLAREDVYNLQRGGHGGFDYINSDKNETYLQTRSSNGKTSKNLIRGLPPGELAERSAKLAAATRLKNGNGFDTFKGRNHTNEAKLKISQKCAIAQRGTNNSQFGTCWIYNAVSLENKKIKKENLQEYIDKGWVPGRKRLSGE